MTRQVGVSRWHLRYVPAVLWALYVVVASLIDPGSGSGPATGPLGVVGFDKWLHVSTYATFAFLSALGMRARTTRQLAVVVLVTVAFGVGIEGLQYPVAARSADIFDAMANTIGAAVGVIIWTVIRQLTTAIRTAAIPD